MFPRNTYSTPDIWKPEIPLIEFDVVEYISQCVIYPGATSREMPAVQEHFWSLFEALVPDTLGRRMLFPLSSGSPQHARVAQPHTLWAAVKSICPHFPCGTYIPWGTMQTPFSQPTSLQQHPLLCSLSLTASGFDPNALFSLWRNIFDSPGVAVVDNGNLLCFMCLENEFPCQKRRAIITSKRDQIGSLKRK